MKLAGTCALLATLAALTPVQAPVQEAAIEREWELRRWALAPREQVAQLRRALEAQDWTRRVVALEALARSARAEPVPELEATVLEQLEHEHPNVRASALAALARTCTAAPPAEELEALVRDVLPQVRLELAELCGRHPSAGAPALLTRLASDPDPRVAAAGRANLLLLPGELAGASEAQARLLIGLYDRGGDRELMRACATLLRGGLGQRALEALHRHLALDTARREEDRRGWRAAVEALRFALGGEGRVDLLLDGWLGSREWLPSRREVLIAAARSGSSDLGAMVLRALVVLEDLQRAPGAVDLPWPGLAADLERLGGEGGGSPGDALTFDLCEAALDCLGPMGALRQAHALPLGAASRELLLSEAGHRVATWDPEVARLWLLGELPEETRVAACHAIGEAFLHRGDRAVGELLAEALAGPSPRVARAAFRVLCDAEQPAPWVPALFAHWSAASAQERDDWLAQLPRGAPLWPFREALIEIGERSLDRRRVAVELLGALEGDATARTAVARWLERDLERLARPPDSGWRYLEMRSMSLVRGLWRIDPDAAVPLVRRALEGSLGRSTDVGKTAAAALAASPAGRVELADFLGSGIDRRTRLEAALALAPRGDGRALEVLMEDYRASAWDVRSRAIDALAEIGEPRAVEFLLAVAGAPGFVPEQRPEAIAALARLGPRDDVLAGLEDLARHSPDFDARSEAVAALGRVGGETAARILTDLWLRLGEDSAEIAIEGERELFREHVLSALGRSGHFPDALLAELLRPAAAEAAETLALRFRGEGVPPAEFRWRGYLELAAALARDGRLGSALDAGPELGRLDARLLLSLAEVAAEAGTPDGRRAARRLGRAGLVALAGEYDPSPSLESRARFRLLRLASLEGDWLDYAVLAEDLHRDRLLDRVSEVVWHENLGTYDRRAGVDPEARLLSSAFQARARLSLERGEVDAARAAARRAARSLGHSDRAAREQAELERAIERVAR